MVCMQLADVKLAVALCSNNDVIKLAGPTQTLHVQILFQGCAFRLILQLICQLWAAMGGHTYMAARGHIAPGASDGVGATHCAT